MPWYPLPTSDGPPGGAPGRLPSLVDSVLAGLGAPTVSEIVRIQEQWDEVVGAELVAHTQPLGIEDGELRIGVDSPAWAGHLRWSEAEIVERAARVLGPGIVTAISARVLRSGGRDRG